MDWLGQRLRAPFVLALFVSGIAASTAPAAADGQYAYDGPGDRRFVNNTAVVDLPGTNNQREKITTPRAEVQAAFTRQAIVVDGVREGAWNAAKPWPIAHAFNADMTGAAPDATARGTLRLLWDGPVLYLLVEVTGDATRSDAGTPTWSRASYAPETDGIVVCMAVFDDRWGIETDTQGVFFLGANPSLTSVTSFSNANIPSQGSFFNPANQDYTTRLKAFKSSGYRDGGVNYTYEIALQIEGWGDEWNRRIANGTRIGLEIGIVDHGRSFTYLSRTRHDGGREANSNLPNSERARNRDWGVVTLSGWDGRSPFAYSGWRADEAIRFWNSKGNPGGSGDGTAADANGDGSLVWTSQSKARMVEARRVYLALPPDATRARKDDAVVAVCEAFAGLRWVDTTFPDPHDLPLVHTLPNVWAFFDKSKGTRGLVTNAREWTERKREILELAQFYEYGYKPRLGEDYTIAVTQNAYDGTGNPTIGARVTPTNARFTGGTPFDWTISINLPADAPDGRKAPIGFGGNWAAYGIAQIAFPNWAGDNRTDAGAWGNPNRNGTFYRVFPYVRNSAMADSSILIANATAVSIYLDVLQMAVAANAQLSARIDPSRAVTKGFSIGGKNAFVAAVFDERVKVVVNGGSGATGPANWRYNAQGQEYDFTGTPFYNPGAERVVAHGTEGPGNSYRHNRVRETELFRHFMPYGHMYRHEGGSYGYGGYGRLPFDQTLLVATLAPDRAILIDTNLNDYNDGATTDNMSLQIAKSVYRVLGANGDDFVKFNAGNYVSTGDPHGAAPAAVEGMFLSDFFFGTKTLTAADAERLNADPYLLKVSNGRTESPYDYYWGGFNTITGGRGGVAGRDGWYFYEFAR
jgi:hypothetical protein